MHAQSVLPREKGVVFQLPDTATCVIPPQTFDDQCLVATAPLSGAHVLMTDATITNPSPTDSVQESILPLNSSPLEKSNAHIFEDMMSSERGDCSLAPDLFIEDGIPIIPPLRLL